VEAQIRDAVPHAAVLTHVEPLEDPASWQDVGLDRDDAALIQPIQEDVR
jgi:hypothetical protein